MADAATYAGGVVLALSTSFMNACGLSLQKLSHKKVAEAQRASHGTSAGASKLAFRHPLWALGLSLMVVGSVASLGTFALLGQARASCFAAVGIVWSAGLAVVLLQERLSWVDGLCTALIVCGIVIAVVFGRDGGGEQAKSTLEDSIARLRTPAAWKGALVVAAAALTLVVIALSAARQREAARARAAVSTAGTLPGSSGASQAEGWGGPHGSTSGVDDAGGRGSHTGSRLLEGGVRVKWTGALPSARARTTGSAVLTDADAALAVIEGDADVDEAMRGVGHAPPTHASRGAAAVLDEYGLRHTRATSTTCAAARRARVSAGGSRSGSGEGPGCDSGTALAGEEPARRGSDAALDAALPPPVAAAPPAPPAAAIPRLDLSLEGVTAAPPPGSGAAWPTSKGGAASQVHLLGKQASPQEAAMEGMIDATDGTASATHGPAPTAPASGLEGTQGRGGARSRQGAVRGAALSRLQALTRGAECFARCVLAGLCSGTTGLCSKLVVVGLVCAVREGPLHVVSSWEWWLLLLGLPLSLVLQLRFLNSALAVFDALEAVPLYQTSITLVGIAFGAVFQGEAAGASTTSMTFFAAGVGVSCCGVLLLMLKKRLLTLLPQLPLPPAARAWLDGAGSCCVRALRCSKRGAGASGTASAGRTPRREEELSQAPTSQRSLLQHTIPAQLGTPRDTSGAAAMPPFAAVASAGSASSAGFGAGGQGAAALPAGLLAAPPAGPLASWGRATRPAAATLQAASDAESLWGKGARVESEDEAAGQGTGVAVCRAPPSLSPCFPPVASGGSAATLAASAVVVGGGVGGGNGSREDGGADGGAPSPGGLGDTYAAAEPAAFLDRSLRIIASEGPRQLSQSLRRLHSAASARFRAGTAGSLSLSRRSRSPAGSTAGGEGDVELGMQLEGCPSAPGTPRLTPAPASLAATVLVPSSATAVIGNRIGAPLSERDNVDVAPVALALRPVLASAAPAEVSATTGSAS